MHFFLDFENYNMLHSDSEEQSEDEYNPNNNDSSSDNYNKRQSSYDIDKAEKNRKKKKKTEPNDILQINIKQGMQIRVLYELHKSTHGMIALIKDTIKKDTEKPVELIPKEWNVSTI